MEAARTLVGQAQRLHGALGEARKGPAVDAYARDQMQGLDPGFAQRVAGYRREAAHRVSEQERVKQRERAQERGRDRGL